MTIAAGLLCRDAVVLAADTEYTGAIKQPGAKVWGLTPEEPSHQVTCAIAGAGDAVLMRVVRDGVARAAAFDQCTTRAMTVDVIEDQLIRVFQKHVFPNFTFTDRNQAVSFVFGIRDGKGCALYETAGTAIAESERYVCLGYGADLGSYLFETLLPDEQPSLPEAITLMVYVLKQAKKYSLYCGGETYIVVLNKNGDMSGVNLDVVAGLEGVLNKGDTPGTSIVIAATELARRKDYLHVMFSPKGSTDSPARRKSKRGRKAPPPSQE